MTRSDIYHHPTNPNTMNYITLFFCVVIVVVPSACSSLAQDSDGLPIAVFCTLFSLVALTLGAPHIFKRDTFAESDSDTRRYVDVNYAAALLHFASASVLGWLAYANKSEWKAPATTTSVVWYRTDDTCTSESPCFLEFVLRHLPEQIPVATLAVLFGLISGAGHAIVAILAPDDAVAFTSTVYEGRNILRWADYALSSSVMIVVIATITGVSEVYVLTSIAMLQFFLMVVSSVIESDLTDGRRARGKILFVIAAIVYVTGVWSPIIGQFYDQPATETKNVTINNVETEVSRADAPEWVSVIIWGLFSVFSCFAIVMAYYIVFNDSKDVKWFLRQELTYIALSLTAKTVLHWTLYNGISSRSDTVFNSSEDIGGTSTRNTDVLNNVLIAGGVFTLLGILFYIAIRVYTGASGNRYTSLRLNGI